MNKLYVIVPVALTLVFGGLYWRHAKQAAVHAEQVATGKAQAEETARLAREAAERQAREDADRRAAERAAEEARKEAERVARQEAESRRIAEETAGYVKRGDELTAEIAALEKELVTVRDRREALRKEVFELALAVEQARIDRRNAELEIQRFVTILATKAGAAVTPTVIPAR